MRWTLLLHHIATIAYSIYALDQYMGELLYAVGNASTPAEAHALFYTEDVTSYANSQHRANARLTIIFAQMQVTLGKDSCVCVALQVLTRLAFSNCS